MTGTIVDDVLAGRRFPYSRAFSRAGFSADEAEAWRRAGWHDPDEAARWKQVSDASPDRLRTLALDGYTVEDVAQVARFAPTLTGAWARALLPRHIGGDGTVDVRDRVLARAHRDARFRHPASWTAEQLETTATG